MPVETFIPRSSNLSSCAYDADSQDLEVTFQSGETYRYLSVPESVWHGLKHAPSAGGYFYRQIRNTFTFEQV